jgi:CBS-domain-containing membrane protein
MKARKASDIMTKDPTCCTPQTTAQQAARLMREHDCGSLPVCAGDGGADRIIGMVTDRDLALRILADGRSPETPVREAMSSQVISCRPDEDLDKVERLMAEHQVRRLPVVDSQGRVIGIVAQADLALHRKEVGEADFSKVVESISEPRAHVRV